MNTPIATMAGTPTKTPIKTPIIMPVVFELDGGSGPPPDDPQH